MKRLVAGILLALPMATLADHLDVIEFKLKEGCEFTTYLQIVRDFNDWGRANGYQAQVLVPLQRANLETRFWVGRAANTEAFGKAWDTWRDAQANPQSVPAKLAARFVACSVNLNRAGFDTF